MYAENARREFFISTENFPWKRTLATYYATLFFKEIIHVFYKKKVLIPLKILILDETVYPQVKYPYE